MTHTCEHIYGDPDLPGSIRCERPVETNLFDDPYCTYHLFHSYTDEYANKTIEFRRRSAGQGGPSPSFALGHKAS